MTADLLADPRTAADPTAAWTALISRYYDGCSAGDVDLMSQAVAGAERVVTRGAE